MNLKRKFKSLAFTITSALLFFCAFKIASLYWLPFVFLLPLFYMSAYYPLSFSDGLLWGIIFWSLHLYPILYVITEKLSLSLFWWIALVVYFAWHAGLWFFINAKLPRISCLASTWCYFVFVDRMVLWVFGQIEGYELAFPLLPLVQNPTFLFFLPYAGKYILLLLLIAAQLFAVQFYRRRNRTSFFLLCGSLLPLFIGFFLPHKVRTPPVWLDKIACVSIVPDEQGIWERLHALRDVVERAKVSSPCLILMPESTLPFCLASDGRALRYLQEYALTDGTELILGGQYIQDGKTYNALYHLADQGIQHIYLKRHGMMIVEREPWLLQFFKRAAGQPFATFAQSQHPGKRIETSLFCAMPLLCSELFFSGYQPHADMLVVCLVNDAWFSRSYQHRLMLMVAQFNAISWQRDILYISYGNAFLIDSSASITHLNIVYPSCW